jgi:hypothetical protein
MTSILFLTLVLLHPSYSVTGNDEVSITEALFAEHTTYFDIEDGSFIGADSLLSALEQAHFVALGELHNRVQLGELTSSLLRYLEPQGFRYFGIETGPYSARKLQNLIGSGRPAVSGFYASYASRILDLMPIPFFKGETDLEFLEAAHDLGFTLWGLDQEFYFSYAFLIDELLHLGGEADTSEQRHLYRKLIRKLKRLDRRNQVAELLGANFKRSCHLKADEDLQAFLDSFALFDHPDIQQISDAFHKTLEIYCMSEQGQASESVRISYFKENFNRNFETALESNPEPKVFLKMGSWHMGRHQSPLNMYDIGNHVSRLAESRNQSSVHIRYLNRYFEGRDVKGRRGWDGVERLVSVGDREKWALIDVRPLHRQISDGMLSGTSFELETILNYDFVIIAPEDDWVKKHW